MLGILNMVLRSLRSLLALVSSSAVLATPPCPAPPVRVCRAPKRLACNRFITAFQLGVSLPHRPAADAGPPETMKVHTPRTFAFDRYAPPSPRPPKPPRFTFDYQPGDVYFCTADCGWITGHSYVTYGPLLNRATQARTHARARARTHAHTHQPPLAFGGLGGCESRGWCVRRCALLRVTRARRRRTASASAAQDDTVQAPYRFIVPRIGCRRKCTSRRAARRDSDVRQRRGPGRGRALRRLGKA